MRAQPPYYMILLPSASSRLGAGSRRGARRVPSVGGSEIRIRAGPQNLYSALTMFVWLVDEYMEGRLGHVYLEEIAGLSSILDS